MTRIQVCFAGVSFVTLLLPMVSTAQKPLPTPPVAAAASNREIYIDVGKAGSRKLRMAILFDNELYSKRLQDIFDFTRSFQFVPAENAEVLVRAKLEKNGLEFSLYDATKKRMLVEKKFAKVDKTKVDLALRKFADAAIESMTGVPGIFSSKIAFAGSRVEGKGKQIFVSNFDGTDMRQVTDNGSINTQPSWSPDGKKLAYMSFVDGKPNVYIYALDTKQTTKLISEPGKYSAPTWSPDGKTIAFDIIQAFTAIYAVDVATGKNRVPLVVSKTDISAEPAYSPDGQSIVYESDRFLRPHVFVRNLKTGVDTRITLSGWNNTSPTWKPDGKKIVFSGADKTTGFFDIFAVNPDGTVLERLTLSDSGDNEKPTFSPDGNFLLFQSNRGELQKTGVHAAFTMTADGGDIRQLRIPLRSVEQPSWGPRIDEPME